MIRKFAKRVSSKWKHLTATRGYCPICEKPVRFVKHGEWLRDNYRCSRCHSIPRYRALIDTIKRFYPDLEKMDVHESSPNNGASSAFLKRRSGKYSASQYFDDVPRGEYKDGFRSEDLSALTFADNSFDLVVTQDVFEHVLKPFEAFKEIARVLKPGGAHVFSMPWYPTMKKSEPRAALKNGKIEFLKDPEYHGNPINREKGSLVTNDWGQDFVDIVYRSSGLCTTIYLQRDPKKGIEGDFLEIFVSRKSAD